jgi:hypothetical protein
MDAPVYPPSAHYEAPAQVLQPMSTRTGSFADFLSNPEALAIMKSEVPAFEPMVSNPMLKPHLGNMGPRDMVQFGAVKADVLDRVDAKLLAAGVKQ